MGSREIVHAGYLPLLDSAVLVVAARLGFAERHDIALTLHREVAWATIRDRMGVGHFDCAHMLAPMAIAGSIGIGPLALPTVAPIVLGLGGNAVTIGRPLAARMERLAGDDGDPARAGAALRTALARLRNDLGRAPCFAVVHRHSSHNYDLRYWLSACGIRPEVDVEITVVPPPLMPDALAGDHIDGFCVGEPWNTIAVRRGVGRIVTTKAEIHRLSPEKVLGIAARLASGRPNTVRALVAACAEAARWCDDPANRDDLAALLAEPRHIGVAAGDLLPALTGDLEIDPGVRRTVPDFMVFGRGGASRPQPAYGTWLLEQMARWKDAEATPQTRRAAAAVFDPGHFDAAVGTPGASVAGPEAIAARLFDHATD